MNVFSPTAKLASALCLDGENADEFCEKVEKVLYAPGFTKDEYDFVTRRLRSSAKLVFRKMSLKKKAGYIFIVY